MQSEEEMRRLGALGWRGCGTGSVSPAMTQARWTSSSPPGDSPRKREHRRTQTRVRTVHTALSREPESGKPPPCLSKMGACAPLALRASAGGRRQTLATHTAVLMCGKWSKPVSPRKMEYIWVCLALRTHGESDCLLRSKVFLGEGGERGDGCF